MKKSTAYTLGRWTALVKLGALSPEMAARVQAAEAAGGAGGFSNLAQYQAAQRAAEFGGDQFAALRPRQQALGRALARQPAVGSLGDVYLEALSPDTRRLMRKGLEYTPTNLWEEALQGARARRPQLLQELGGVTQTGGLANQQITERFGPTPRSTATPARIIRDSNIARHIQGSDATISGGTKPGTGGHTRAGITRTVRATAPLQKLRPLVTVARRLAHV